MIQQLNAVAFVRLVGDRALAERIMRAAAGHKIPHLTTRHVSREARNARIRADFDAGFTYEETAKRNAVSRYTVWQVVRLPATPHATK